MTNEGPANQSSSVTGNGSQSRDRLREATSASWRAAGARLARLSDDVRIEARSTAHAAERYAREKPWRVAGMAAAIALLAGYLIGAQVGRAQWRRRAGA